MILRVARFIGLLFMALALGFGFAALIGSGARSDLSGTVFLTVQQVLYRDMGRILSVVEPIAYIAVLIAMLGVSKRRPFFIMTLVCFASLTLMIVLRFLFVRPLQMEINSWTAQSIPDNWVLLRNRYYLYGEIRSGFSIIGFCSLSLSVLFDTPPYRVKKTSP
jgi:hypothetical protein